jgi:hypothetical protein
MVSAALAIGTLIAVMSIKSAINYVSSGPTHAQAEQVQR